MNVHSLTPYYTCNFRLVPAKIVRDWKMLLIAGQPLYEGDGDMSDAKSSEVSGSSYNHSQRNFNDNQQLLDDTDFQEYKVGGASI